MSECAGRMIMIMTMMVIRLRREDGSRDVDADHDDLLSSIVPLPLLMLILV